MTIKFVPSFKTLLSPFFLFLPLFIQAQTVFNGQVRDAYTQAALGLVVTALVSALYPALRAARFRPTEALRKV